MMYKGVDFEEHVLLPFAFLFFKFFFWKSYILVWVPNMDEQRGIELMVSIFALPASITLV